MNRSRVDYIRQKVEFAEDFPDGAFMGYMEESGIDVAELAAVCLHTDNCACAHCPKFGPDGYPVGTEP